MRKMTEAKRSLLLALIGEGATGIVISSQGVWRVVGHDKTGKAPQGYATDATWTRSTVMALWTEDLLVDCVVPSRGAFRLGSAGRVRAALFGQGVA